MNKSVGQRRFNMTPGDDVRDSARSHWPASGCTVCLAYSVTRRRNEIGIRMALGAGAAEVGAWCWARESSRSCSASGRRRSLARGRQILSSLLFQVSPRDPLTIAAVALALCLVAIACMLPALRATRVNPLLLSAANERRPSDLRKHRPG